jgi:hypothetical protein
MRSNRQTIGFDDLLSLGIPHTLAVVRAMSEMPNWFPRPINGKYAKFPLWNRNDVELWCRENLAPNNRRREPIGTEKWRNWYD